VPAGSERRVPGEGGEYGAVRPGQPGPGCELAARDGHLMAQCQQFDILLALGT
jgi:hypothetical protein